MSENKRQQLILDIIQSNNVENKEQLNAILKSKGLEPAWSTILEDMKKLGISKIQVANHKYRYVVYHTLDERMKRIFKEATLSIKKSNQLIIVKTIPHCAKICSQYIANAKLDNISRIITGIGIISITPKNIDSIDDLVKDIQTLIQ